jgi:heptosyltransferase-2
VRPLGIRKLYLLPYSFNSAWFGYRSGIPLRRGIDKDLRGMLLTEPLPASTRDYTRHITREYAAVLQAGAFDPVAWSGLAVTGSAEYAGRIVFCPGAKFGPSKQWQGFRDLAALLSGERIVILGGADDDLEARAIAGQAPDRIVNLAGKTTLPEAAAIIAAGRCVVSNDSGLMHVAAFIGTPAAAVFGSTSPAWTRPLGRGARVLYTAESCSPCFSRTCRYGHYRCLTAITPRMVDRTVREIIHAPVGAQPGEL